MDCLIKKGGSTATLTGDAIAANVLSGKTFYNTDPNNKITGTATFADASVSGTTLTITDGFPIPNSGGTDVSNTTATVSDVLEGMYFYNSNAEYVEGTIVDRGAVTATITGLGVVSGDTSYTIPAGYHNGSGTVSLTSDIYDQLAAM